MNLKLCVYICVCGREYNRVKKSLGEFKPCCEKIASLRFLLHGPVGAGKSSTINSIRSVFKEEILTGALASTQQAGGSFTKNVSLYCKDSMLGIMLWKDVCGVCSSLSKTVNAFKY